MIFVANILYRVFEESMIAEPYPSNVNQSTVVSSISNQPQPLMQPVVQPVMQPVVQPVVQPVMQSVMQPVVEPVMQSAVLNEKPPFIGPVEEDYANNGPFPPKINYSAYPGSVKESGINYNF